MIHTYSYTQLRDKFISGELTPSEVTAFYLSNTEKYKHLNNFITICAEEALTQAKIADERYKNGTARILEGMPLSVKDLFCTAGIKTTAASKILGNFTPQYESVVSQLAKEAGCIMLGKCNMDEFAMGASTRYSAYGPAYNPWHQNDNKPFTPGGSSGGSASSCAAYQALFSLGSDTGGSIRQPAAFCGIVGIRPTYGRCSRRGMIAFASSLDQAGTLGRDVKTAAALLQEVMCFDQYDSTSANKPKLDLLNLKGDVKGLKVGLLKADFLKDEDIKNALDKTAKWLEDNGAIIEEISIPHLEDALSIYYVLSPCEAASNLARYDGARHGTKGPGATYYEQCMSTRELFGDEVKRRVLIGTYFSSSAMYEKYFSQAWKVRKLLKYEFDQAFKKFDIILSPTTPHTAFNTPKTPVELYYEDYFTAPVNITLSCAISVPVGLSSNNMPIGIQVIAPAFREDLLIKAGLCIEKEAQFPFLDPSNVFMI